ncbi:MAG: YidC/Oxa1 family membrane protein insertase [Patescibacteria group bacterium]
MGNIFHVALYEPLLNALLFLVKIIPGHDLGIAIIFFTIIIRLILYIPSLSSIKQQRQMQEIQPKLNALKAKYKDNREELGRQTMQFYKDNKVNPFSSCLPLLIQLPILYALFRVFLTGITTDAATGLLAPAEINNLYGPLRDYFTTHSLNTMFLGFVDLTRTGNWVLALLAGAAQFYQSKMLISKQPPKNMPGAKDEGMAAATSRTMTYFLPIMIVFFSLRFPAGLALYWLVTTLFAVAQQFIYLKKRPVKLEGNDIKP